MSVTINGTSGVTTPGINNSEGYTGDGLTIAAGAPAGAVTVDASGNLGVGTSLPITKVDVRGRVRIGDYGGTYQGATLINGVDSSLVETVSFIDAQNNLGTTDTNIFFGHETNGGAYLGFATTSSGSRSVDRRAERMRLDASGNLLVGTTSAIGSGKFTVVTSGASNFAAKTRGTDRGIAVDVTDTSGIAMYFTTSNSTVQAGQITVNANTTSYLSGSDYRLKENVQPMTGALAKVAALNPVTWTWKANSSSGQGFIAHELQAVVPECVYGEKDAVDAEGKPVYQGVDTSFLVATLTAAIQEQQAIITDLKARIEQLEAK